jgi:hypothetical protein
MKTQHNFFLTIPGVALVTLILLMIPFIAMQFSNEVNWSVSDFIVMGLLIFSTGSAFVLFTRYASNVIYRTAMGTAIGTTFLMVWANLAVGLIGSGPHAGNLMYIGVIAVALIGTYYSRFTAAGMARAMVATAFSLVAVAVIQYMAGIQHYPASSVGEIIAVNSFFAMLYCISGLQFRYVALHSSAGKSDG